MIKKTLRGLSVAFFIAAFFKVDAYALKLQASAPSEVDENNLEKAGLKIPKGVEQILRPNIEYRAKGLRNPFEQSGLGTETEKGEGPEVKEATLPALTVQGVIWEGNPKQVIINNKVLKVGDTFENVDIVDINKNGVTVLFTGVEYKLSTIPATGQQENSEN